MDHTKHCDYFSNLRLKFEHNYYMGELHGIQRGYYENGSSFYFTSYNQGVRHGTQWFWHSNGKLKLKLRYECGKLQAVEYNANEFGFVY